MPNDDDVSYGVSEDLEALAVSDFAKANQPPQGLMAQGGMSGGSTIPRKPGPYQEVGVEGLAQYGGFVRDEFLPQLMGDRALKAYREMYDNDPIIGAIVFAIQMLVRKVEWRVEPPIAASVEEIVQAREDKKKAIQLKKLADKQAAMAPAAPGMAPDNTGGAPQPSGPDQYPHVPAVAAGAPGKPSKPNLQSPRAPNPPRPPAVKKSLFDGDDLWFGKAGGTATGQFVGGIESSIPSDASPIDPETGEPMEFPEGLGPLDEPTPEQRKALELAVFVETVIHDLAGSWSDLLSQIMTMIVFGFSFNEIVYKKRKGPNVDYPEQGSRFNDGKIGWAKIAGRAQETRFRWEFDDNGDVLGMWQLAPPKYQITYIPMSKALLFRTTAYKGNPEGRSIIRSAFRSWQFKKRIEEFEAIGVERNLAGLPVMYVPWQLMSASATPEEKAALFEIKKIVRNVRRDEQGGLVLPQVFDPDHNNPLYKFELLSVQNTRPQDTDKIIARYDQRMAMVVLADFILLGHEAVGAKALAETKVELFTDACEAWLNVIADTFNTHAIPRLLKINGEDPALAPKLSFGKLTRISLNELANFITAMAGAGVELFPDQELESYVRTTAGLPEADSSSSL